MRIEGRLCLLPWAWLFFSLNCFGPDIGEKLSGSANQNTSSPQASIPVPQIILPVSGYRTSSLMIRFQSDDNPQADNAEIEVSQGASVIYAGAVTTGVSWHTLPNGSTGTLSIRARNIKAGVYSSYSAATSFTVEDYSAATQLYSKTYNTVSPGCGSSSGFPSAWSVFCNSDPAWGSLCTDAFGGGGNVWIPRAVEMRRLHVSRPWPLSRHRSLGGSHTVERPPPGQSARRARPRRHSCTC